MPSAVDDQALDFAGRSDAATADEALYLVDRRRPGRIEYENRHLIAVLRDAPPGCSGTEALHYTPRARASSTWAMIGLTIVSAAFWVGAVQVLGIAK
jgi:hypothetical protein